MRDSFLSFTFFTPSGLLQAQGFRLVSPDWQTLSSRRWGLGTGLAVAHNYLKFYCTDIEEEFLLNIFNSVKIPYMHDTIFQVLDHSSLAGHACHCMQMLVGMKHFHTQSCVYIHIFCYDYHSHNIITCLQ